ncbi:MAG: cytochrome c-type biogenesis protein CcmH/NrfG [Pseudohongiellaceae bacterium]|jgi:cytochrome c-type biogenesis protein CcmH/NrfG
MSLLMDALRKAEESKKQAEKDKKAASSAEVAVPAAELTSPKQAAAVEPADQINFTNTDKLEPATPRSVATEPVSGEPSLSSIDYKGTTEPSANVVQAESLEPAIDTDTGPFSLELEPKLQTTASTQSYTTDQLHFSVDGGDKAEAEQVSFRGQDEDTDSISSFLLSSKLEQAVSKASAELAKQEPSALPKTVARNTDPVKEATVATAQVKAAPESIVQRTAGSRESAKSVFSAKKQGQKSTRPLLLAVVGIAAVVVIGLGFYLSISLTANSGISLLADNVPVGQPFENNNSIMDLVVEEESMASVTTRDEASQGSTGVNSLQTEALYGLDAVADNTAAVISQPSASLQTLNLSRIEDFSVNQQTPLEARPDIAPAAPVSLSNEVVDQPVENLVAADPISGPASPSTPSSPAPNPSSSSAGSSISDSQMASGGTLDAVANIAPRAAPAARDLVSFRRTNQPQAIAPSLTEGFRAYQNGDLNLARDLYEQTLTDTPENIDALLGLAAIAGSAQEVSLAMGLYSRVLSLDPSNALAKTAIRALAPLGTPAEQERELRRLDSQNPNVAPLSFALGNFYASHSRWTDAQRYYFKALQLAKSNSQSGAAISPDYAFNLAVSLERLNKRGPALNFYEEALALATRFPSNFDLSIARARLESLSRANSQ